MATIQRERTERKPKPRTCGVPAVEGEWWLLEIEQQLSKRRTQTDHYFARRLPASFGSGFELEKQDEQGTVCVYHVNLHGLDGYHLCDCRGFGAHAHCKHVEALLALEQAGKLPPRGELTAQVESYSPTSIPLYRSVEELFAADGRQFRSSGDIAANAPELVYEETEPYPEDFTFDLNEEWEASGGIWEPTDDLPPAA